MTEWHSSFLADIRATFAAQRQLAERAIEQLDEAQLFRAPAVGENSVAVLMKHVGGNLRSRWREPFTTDGEKPDRHRDSEFAVSSDESEAAIHMVWADGWSILEETLAGLTDADLGRSVAIRHQRVALPLALLRSLAHTAQHTGQIVLLARHWKGDEWETLSIPRGRSADYLARPPE
ncbi:MAG TPA: DUF1572 family protein [Longimicrobiales bacterium]|nr:DUF1572 family protein [Longimicrobiales bacterium]